MQINLRKAAALQTAINETIRAIKLPFTVTITQYEDESSVLDRATDQVMLAVTRRSDLTRAMYEIRQQIGEANHTNGIDALLNSIAYTAKQIEYAVAITVEPVRQPPEVIKGKLDRMRSTTEETYSTSVSTGVLTETDMALFQQSLQDLKKERLKLNDDLLAANVSTKITLSDRVVELLKRENLI